MQEDIRDKPELNHKDVVELNFIREPGVYLYRRHYRAGLRSHIMEVLSPEVVQNEKKGIIIDGLKWYPRAEPLKMLRIFRTRFDHIEEAEEELNRVSILENYLAPDNIARPEEFLVHYNRSGKHEVLLCGLQEYVKGEVLEPWGLLDRDHLVSLLYRMDAKKVEDSAMVTDQWAQRVREKAENFIGKVKKMILEAHYVPDLAGVGNLILNLTGNIKLVDINNISTVEFGPIINLDDRGYPVCDKSIEALSLLEQKLLGRSSFRDDFIYRKFLDPERMKKVKAAVEKFHLSTEPSVSYPRRSL